MGMHSCIQDKCEMLGIKWVVGEKILLLLYTNMYLNEWRHLNKFLENVDDDVGTQEQAILIFLMLCFH